MSAVPKPRLIFQSMVEADLDAVVAAEQRIYPFPWTRGNFADSLTADYRCWVCHENGALITYAVAMEVIEEVHLLNLSVIPERQRGGIGSAMLEHLFDDARRRTIKRMLLEVRPSNVSGRALYRRYGFTVIGHRRDYYPAAQGRENAIVMLLDL
jgi:[ribosomal protein S18]-alanine N-acetyltransferase